MRSVRWSIATDFSRPLSIAIELTETTMKKSTTHMLFPACALLLAATTAMAENDAGARFRGTGQADPIRIANVQRVADKDAVTFDIAWDHSWRATWTEPAEKNAIGKPLTVENWDAAWVFIKFHTPGADGWLHAPLSTTVSEHAVPAGVKLDLGKTDDGQRGVGVFLYRQAPGQGPIDWKGISLQCMDLPADAEVKVLALNMVYVPQGAFWAGDGSTNHVEGQFSAGGSAKPFRIENEGAIQLGGEDATRLNTRDSIGMQLQACDDFNIDQKRRLPENFPKGYAAFYCMKREVTQQQYVNFLNTLGFKSQCEYTGKGKKAGKADAPVGTVAIVPPTDMPCRNKIRIAVSGSAGTPARPAVYETELPHVACGSLGYHQSAAFAAWAGLRPMTELEFEKACRGPLNPVADEYAWGTDGIVGPGTGKGTYKIQSAGQPDETAVWTGDAGPDATHGNALCSWNSPWAGALRVGLFMTPDSDRVRSGASYWGITELSGNMVETVITVGSPAGRAFAGTHGEGDDWPWKAIAFSQRGGGVPYGSHARGWAGDEGLRTSNRFLGPTHCTGGEAQWAIGFRGVRTAPKEK